MNSFGKPRRNVEHDPARDPVAGEARRREVIDALCESFARDELVLADFERRVDAAHRAATEAELAALLDDLPSAPTLPAPPAPPAGPRSRSEVVAGVLGGASRRGSWDVARRIRAVAVMGGVELDFREVALPRGVTEVHAFAVMGGVEILVPPGVRLESSGVGVLGAFDHGDPGDPTLRADAPTLRITGAAVMGGVEIHVRLPGESGRDARRRVREERERRRRLQNRDRG